MRYLLSFLIIFALHVDADVVKVKEVFSTHSAFAALLTNGSVVTWGDKYCGGSSPQDRLSKDIVNIYSTYKTFAALKKDKTLFTWGSERSEYGRDSNVVDVTTNKEAFVALHVDGTIKVWGSRVSGGYLHEDKVPTNVKKVYSSKYSFAALLNDGTVFSWGLVGRDKFVMENGEKIKNVIDIVGTNEAFAALKSDGTVISWGRNTYGGDSSHLVLKDVVSISSNNYAFAALLKDKTVKTWGNENNGGNSDYVELKNVKKIYNNLASFAALTYDNSVIVWGNEENGGSQKFVDIKSDVVDITASSYGYGAIKKDGSAVFWGKGFFAYPHDQEPKSEKSAVGFGKYKNFIKSGVKKIFANPYSFAVIKEDGSIDTLGENVYNGNDLNDKVTNIYTNLFSFVAIKSDGEVIAWGKDSYGGNAWGVAHKLNPSAYKDIEAFSTVQTYLKKEGK